MNHFSPKFVSSAPTKYGYGPYAKITVSDPDPVDYTQAYRDSHVIVLKRVDNPKIIQTIRQDDFHVLVEQKKVRHDPKFFDVARQTVLALNPDIQSERDLDGDQSDQIEFYRRLIYLIDVMRHNGEASLTDKSLKVAIRKARLELIDAMDSVGSAGDIKARQTTNYPGVPSPGTLRRWRRKLNALDGEPLALRDRRRARSGNRGPRIQDPLVLSIFGETVRAYLDSNCPTVAGLHKGMKKRFKDKNNERLALGLLKLPVPSLSTLERAIRKLDEFQVVLAREGEAAAKKLCKISGRQELATRPGERVAIDNWRMHISALKLPASFWDGVDEKLRGKLGRIRLNLCIAIDQATRIVLGARLSINADTTTSLRTLEMACRDKTGIAIAAGCASTWHHVVTPEIVPTDNGSEFANAVMRAAVLALGAETELGIAGEPNGRPIAERFFGTVDSSFLQFFTGRTFSNVGDKGDYDPQKMASVLVEALSGLFVRWLVDVYHNTPHAGLGMETPNDAWERCCARYGVGSGPDSDQLRAVFGFMDTRRIVNRGICFLGLYYSSELLGRMRAAVGQEDVIIRADLEDLGWISVRRNQKGAPWISVPCELEEFEGVSAARWLDVTAAIRRKHADTSALREDIVLDAMRDLSAAGRWMSEQAGLGPTILTDERLKREEKEMYTKFNIVLAPKRGTSLDGMLDGVESIEVVEAAPVAKTPPSGQRRGLHDDNFLLED